MRRGTGGAGVALILLTLAGCASAPTPVAEGVAVSRSVDGGLPVERAGCEYLGPTEIRTTVGDRTQTAFSWDADPKYSAYLESLKAKAARQGADTIVVGNPREADFGTEAFLSASMFQCGAG